MRLAAPAFYVVAFVLVNAVGLAVPPDSALAQETAAASPPEAAVPLAPEPLTEDELEILVSRIALYPDELIALVVSSSLFPLQIVEGQRYLDEVKAKPELKPKSTWDSSVVSLLNYPQIVKMMSDDLDWTQALAEAITNQQKEVLQTIQDLRAQAVADGIIKSDEKVTVVQEKETIVIQPASKEVIYVPQYEPEMLYVESYPPAPISYWPEPYPYWYDPVAPYFPWFFTGAIFGAAIDWGDWGIWGGNWDGGDLDIDCNKCFNNIDFDGKLDFDRSDWQNIDRSKINFDRNQINSLDKTKIRDGLKSNSRNNLKNKAGDLKRTRPSTLPANKGRAGDVRKSTLEGLKAKPSDRMNKPGAAGDRRPGGGQNAGANRPGGGTKPGAGANRPSTRPSGGKIDRPAGKPKPAARPDSRPKKAGPMGDAKRGSKAKYDLRRGQKSMGGGMRSGGGPKRHASGRGRGGGGGGRGGGGRR